MSNKPSFNGTPSATVLLTDFFETRFSDAALRKQALCSGATSYCMEMFDVLKIFKSKYPSAEKRKKNKKNEKKENTINNICEEQGAHNWFMCAENIRLE